MDELNSFLIWQRQLWNWYSISYRIWSKLLILKHRWKYSTIIKLLKGC